MVGLAVGIVDVDLEHDHMEGMTDQAVVVLAADENN